MDCPGGPFRTNLRNTILKSLSVDGSDSVFVNEMSNSR